MERRGFIGSLLAGGALGSLFSAQKAVAAEAKQGGNDRQYMAGLLQKMAEPVLVNMANGELKKKFALELSPIWDGRDPGVSYLECFGRLIAGMAPWLALPEDSSAEGRSRKRLHQLALQSYANSVDPNSPDYLLWNSNSGQTLVDSAYFTNALMRAPKALWEPLDAVTRQRIIKEIKGLRRIDPPNTNWLLFAAMNEAWLFSIGEQHDPLRISSAVRKINQWYVGDGWIKDGESFSFDYYNSYVMYPMLVEILEVLTNQKGEINSAVPAELLAQAQKRMQRYCSHLERFIGPDGTYPPIGRSLTYRTAAFQPLALLALRKQLPAELPEGQVRAALTAVHRAVWSDPGNFTKDGFLTLGFVGHQPELADWYSNSGSMYIASEGFLALGLPADDSFWTAPALDWTQKKAFSGRKFPKDYHVKY